MNAREPSIRVNVDPSNPGQFFACCGLLELADRLWPGAEGRFGEAEFLICTQGDLPDLMQAVAEAELLQADAADNTASPIDLGRPFRPMRLDWWRDEWAGGKELKVWAGTMESVRIARAMQFAIRDARFHSEQMFDIGMIAYDPENTSKKVEPYYFDARRGPNAHSRDVGFSPNDLQMTTIAYPAVELLCLVGLQRSRPRKTSQPRVFDYWIWNVPTPVGLLAAAVPGDLRLRGSRTYRFENWFRTGQRKHKAFRSANLLSE